MTSRRTFLTTAGASALSLAAVSAQTKAPRKTLKIGAVGIGRRGSGAIVDALTADPDTVLWAIGDINEGVTNKASASYSEKFKDRAQLKDRTFVGFDSFEKVLKSGVDVILLCTPPAFRPYQIKAALEAGVHVFAEKPWCIDGPGLNTVTEAVKAGNAKGLSFLTGLVWRHTAEAKKIYSTALSGDLGDVRTAHGYYLGYNAHDMDLTGLKTLYEHSTNYNWVHFRELSGDYILEQYIHSVDKLGWAMNDEAPSRCYGAGGQQNIGKGRNVYDHISVTYEYDDGRRAYLNGSHCNRFYTVHDEIYCDNGSARLSNGNCFIKKGKETIYKAQNPHLGYVAEHKELFDHIRQGKVYTDIEKATNTHLLAIMGRMAAYTGQEIYAEDVFESDEVLFDSSQALSADMPFNEGPVIMPYIRSGN